MNYQLKAYPIHELGKREGQEDSIFPAKGKATAADRLFMVCDGMGGHEAGEVASAAVIEAMSKYILAHTQPDGEFADEVLIEALAQAYDLLDERDPHPDSLKKMGTTMTLLKFHARGITIAHIGDSRVYQFRPTPSGVKVVFQTEDHSLVNDLLRIGELTQEEAANYPRKNVITRAMQSHLDYRPKADIYHSADVQPGDYFYLCSDGMLENATNDNLCNILQMAGKSDEEEVKILIQNSEENKDNHSAYLVHVLSVTGGQTASAANRPSPFPAGQMAAAPAPASNSFPSGSQSVKPARRINFNYVLIGAVAVLAVAIWFFTRPSKTEAPQSEQTENVWNKMKPNPQKDQKQKPQKPQKQKTKTQKQSKPAAGSDKATPHKEPTKDKKPEDKQADKQSKENEKPETATETTQEQTETQGEPSSFQKMMQKVTNEAGKLKTKPTENPKEDPSQKKEQQNSQSEGKEQKANKTTNENELHENNL